MREECLKIWPWTDDDLFGVPLFSIRYQLTRFNSCHCRWIFEIVTTILEPKKNLLDGILGINTDFWFTPKSTEQPFLNQTRTFLQSRFWSQGTQPLDVLSWRDTILQIYNFLFGTSHQQRTTEIEPKLGTLAKLQPKIASSVRSLKDFPGLMPRGWIIPKFRTEAPLARGSLSNTVAFFVV